MAVIELFGIAALTALAALAVLLVAVLLRDSGPWQGCNATEADEDAVEADLSAHGVRHP